MPISLFGFRTGLQAIKVLLSFCLLWLSQNHSHAQITLAEQPTTFSQDRNGNIFYADSRGNIHKLSEGGYPLEVYSPQKPGEVGAIDAWFTVKIYAFFPNYQHILLLNRLMGVSDRIELGSLAEVGFVSQAAPAADGTFWLFDQSDFSLKKYDPNIKHMLLNTPLSLVLTDEIYDITYMREYENLLFLAEETKGIYIFDNMGNFMRKIPATGVKWFSFNGDDLLFIDSNTGLATAYQLYDGATRKIDLPIENPDFLLINSKHTIAVKKQELHILER